MFNKTKHSLIKHHISISYSSSLTQPWINLFFVFMLFMLSFFGSLTQPRASEHPGTVFMQTIFQASNKIKSFYIYKYFLDPAFLCLVSLRSIMFLSVPISQTVKDTTISCTTNSIKYLCSTGMIEQDKLTSTSQAGLWCYKSSTSHLYQHMHKINSLTRTPF